MGREEGARWPGELDTRLNARSPSLGGGHLPPPSHQAAFQCARSCRSGLPCQAPPRVCRAPPLGWPTSCPEEAPRRSVSQLLRERYRPAHKPARPPCMPHTQPPACLPHSHPLARLLFPPACNIATHLSDLPATHPPALPATWLAPSRPLLSASVDIGPATGWTVKMREN